MAEVRITLTQDVDLNVYCDKCGGSVNARLDRDGELAVIPCEKCVSVDYVPASVALPAKGKGRK